MEVPSHKETIIVEKHERMVSPSNETPIYRLAHFLEPPFPLLTKTKTLINPPPKIPQTSKPISSILKTLSSNVHFHTWKCPNKSWTNWVKKLTPKYQSTWKKACIFEAIMTTTFEIPKCELPIFSFAEKWCPKTSSFVLPWGEVTLTLEDIMVLGCFSITGDSILSEVSSKKDLEIEENLLKARMEIVRSSYRKASQLKWMKDWMEKEGEFEHEAFLSLWLSRFVLPNSIDTIDKRVFQIAILLAKGTKIALGPPVLGSLYRDLRLLNEKIRSVGEFDDKLTKLVVFAPLQLLQCWIWERFPALSTTPNLMSKGVCRLERWLRVQVYNVDDIVKVIDSAVGDFEWRPYSKEVNNFRFDLDLESYVRCIRVAPLVGMDSSERYFPHRVAMQFGIDQDVPLDCSCLTELSDDAWSYYNKPIGDVKLYMPPKTFKAAVTTRYLDWWRNCEVVKGSGSCDRKKEGCLEVSMEMAERVRVKVENNAAEVPPGYSPGDKRVAVVIDDGSDEYKPYWKRSRRSSGSRVVEIECSESNASPGSSPMKEVKVGEEEEENDDYRTLSQFFKVSGSKPGDNSGTQESPLSSASDHPLIQVENMAPKYTEHNMPWEECMKKSFTIKDGSASNVGSSIKSEIQASFDGACEPSGIDLEVRIKRLQKIIDMVKAAKLSQTRV